MNEKVKEFGIIQKLYVIIMDYNLLLKSILRLILMRYGQKWVGKNRKMGLVFCAMKCSKFFLQKMV